MKYTRWYDKNPDLHSLLVLLENLNTDDLQTISEDFLQITINKYGEKFDEIISLLSANTPPAYERWYDKDYNLHTCIELLRISDENERKELVRLFIISVMGYLSNNGK